jgi:hypothetical protein
MPHSHHPRGLKSIAYAFAGLFFLLALLAASDGLLGDQEKPKDPDVKRVVTKTSSGGGSSNTGKRLSPGEYELIIKKGQQADDPGKVSGNAGSAERMPMRSSVGGGGKKAKLSLRKKKDLKNLSEKSDR